MEIFVHAAGSEHPEIAEVDETVRVRELLVGHDPDARIWIEEIDDEVSLDLTLVEAGIRRHHHVHRSRCHRVEVVVRYNGQSFESTFGPGATIKLVEKWAFGPNAADLSPEQAAKHVLVVPGSDHFLAATVHIGSLVTVESCQVTLDLVPRDRFEG